MVDFTDLTSLIVEMFSLFRNLVSEVLELYVNDFVFLIISLLLVKFMLLMLYLLFKSISDDMSKTIKKK